MGCLAMGRERPVLVLKDGHFHPGPSKEGEKRKSGVLGKQDHANSEIRSPACRDAPAHLRDHGLVLPSPCHPDFSATPAVGTA